MNRRHYLIVLIGLVLFSACDPFKLLFITNETDKELDVTVILKDCNASFIQELQKKDALERIKLSTIEDTNTFEYFFGIGTWSEKELAILYQCIEAIIIEEGTNTRKIEGETLQRMLPEKREGIFKSVLTIKILSKKCKLTSKMKSALPLIFVYWW